MKSKKIKHFSESLNQQSDFKQYFIDYKNNIFDEFGQSRQATVLVDYDNVNKIYPLVRTTTIYQKPAQKFRQIHYDIIQNIKKVSNINDLQLNNALIEIYGNEYKSMGYHSDQALDLADDSCICLVSLYNNNIQNNNNDNNNNNQCLRQLQIRNKESGLEQQIQLERNSVIVFSTQTNKLYQHKIIIKAGEQLCQNQIINDPQNKWLGVTFRLSKTLIQFIYEPVTMSHMPYFYQTNNQLMMVTKEQIKQFYINRQKENNETNYEQQYINYTISPSDLLLID